MKFIVDAQLPRRLSHWLNENGHDSKHTLDLVKKNKSSDIEISQLADQEARIVISKDTDFLDDHLLNNRPKMLLIIKTGNIRNSELIDLFDNCIEQLENLFQHHALVELSQTAIIAHDNK